MKKKLAEEQAKSVNSLKKCPSDELFGTKMHTFQLVSLVSLGHHHNQMSTRNRVIIKKNTYNLRFESYLNFNTPEKQC